MTVCESCYYLAVQQTLHFALKRAELAAAVDPDSLPWTKVDRIHVLGILPWANPHVDQVRSTGTHEEDETTIFPCLGTTPPLSQRMMKRVDGFADHDGTPDGELPPMTMRPRPPGRSQYCLR